MHLQQLSEGDAPPRLLQALLVVRIVHLASRRRQGGKALPSFDLGRKLIDERCGRGQGLPYTRPEPARCQSLGLGIDGDQPAGVETRPLCPLEGRVHHHQAPAARRSLHLARQHQLVFRVQLPHEIRLVEPDRLHAPAVVAEVGLDHLDLARGKAEADGLQLDPDRLLQPLLQEADVDNRGEVLVAAGIVTEQVGDGLDADLAQPPTVGLTHAPERGHGRAQVGNDGARSIQSCRAM